MLRNKYLPINTYKAERYPLHLNTVHPNISKFSLFLIIGTKKKQKHFTINFFEYPVDIVPFSRYTI